MLKANLCCWGAKGRQGPPRLPIAAWWVLRGAHGLGPGRLNRPRESRLEAGGRLLWKLWHRSHCSRTILASFTAFPPCLRRLRPC